MSRPRLSPAAAATNVQPRSNFPAPYRTSACCGWGQPRSVQWLHMAFITAPNEISYNLQLLLACNRVRLLKLMPFDIDPGGMQHLHLFFNPCEGNHRIERAMRH